MDGPLGSFLQLTVDVGGVLGPGGEVVLALLLGIVVCD